MPKITPIHYRKLVKVFEKEGWRIVRQKGDHIIMFKKGYVRPVVIPAYKSIPVFVILNNLRTAKISRDKYFKLLKEV